MSDSKDKASAKMSCLSPSEIAGRLKEKGVQATMQRVAICQYVLCEADHPTAEEVYQWTQKNSDKFLAQISLATVYNTLGTLVEVGILKEYRLSHTDKVIYDNNVTHHYHFLDEDSGKVMDVHPEDLRIELRGKESPFLVHGFEVLLRGTFKKDHSKKIKAQTKEK